MNKAIKKYGQVIVSEEDIVITGFTFTVPLEQARVEALEWATKSINDCLASKELSNEQQTL